MRSFYINYVVNYELIIDEYTLEQAEQGNSYLNPDEFIFLCEARNIEEAEQKYRTDFWICECELMHP